MKRVCRGKSENCGSIGWTKPVSSSIFSGVFSTMRISVGRFLNDVLWLILHCSTKWDNVCIPPSPRGGWEMSPYHETLSQGYKGVLCHSFCRFSFNRWVHFKFVLLCIVEVRSSSISWCIHTVGEHHVYTPLGKCTLSILQ